MKELKSIEEIAREWSTKVGKIELSNIQHWIELEKIMLENGYPEEMVFDSLSKLKAKFTDGD